jgi:valyl-tRNA synthetase
MKIKNITFYFLGAVLQIEKDCQTALGNIKISIVRPLLCFETTLILILISNPTESNEQIFTNILNRVAILNLFLGLLNLIPIGSLDGGNLLKSTIWYFSGSKNKGRNFLNKLWNANNFLRQNECDFDKKLKIPKISININKWIYSQLIDTKNLIEKNIKAYRFDEASRNAYKFVWNSYCDWYLELSKTIFYSKDKKAIKEVRAVSSYIFKQILILLHPFIPFITEEIWLKNKLDNSKKNFLMFANWPSDKLNKDKNLREVENIISIITEIRSFKNELNVSPGSFIDISIEKINKKNKKFFVNNNIVLKRLGRINNFLDKDKNIPSATLIIESDILKLYFDQSVDLNLIKENLTKKQSKYQEDLNKISQRLSNKGFVERAPKNIVDQEKTNYSNLKNDINKISITIKNL